MVARSDNTAIFFTITNSPSRGTSKCRHALFRGRSFSPAVVPSRPVDRASVDGASDHLADLRVRQEQFVVDDAPALRRGVNYVQPEPHQLGLFGGADAGDAAG